MSGLGQLTRAYGTQAVGLQTAVQMFGRGLKPGLSEPVRKEGL